MSPVVYTETGKQVELLGMGAAGGEGEIFRVKGSELECAKIYLPGKITTELRAKISAMVKNAPVDPNWRMLGFRSIAWPAATLFFDPAGKKFAGFSMPFIDTKKYKPADRFYSASDRARLFPGFTWEYLVTAAFNLASAVDALHKAGHCVGDLQDQNVLISDRALVALVDCDSFQVRDKDTGKVFYTRVGIGEYRAPEVMPKDFVKEDLDRYYTDLFALAIIVFKLLMNGFHPFSGKGRAVEDAPTKEEKIVKGLFPYSGKFKKKDLEPSPHAPPYKLVPPALQELFKRSLVEGHSKPSARPGAEEWFAALKEAKTRLKKCKNSPHHAYSDHLVTCPWCEMEKNTGNDPFPMAGRQTPLKPARPAARPKPPAASTMAAVSKPGFAAQRRPWRQRGLDIIRDPLLWFRLKLVAGAFMLGAGLGLLVSFLKLPLKTVTLGDMTLTGTQVFILSSALIAWLITPFLAYWRRTTFNVFTAMILAVVFAGLTWAVNYLLKIQSCHLLAALCWGVILAGPAKIFSRRIFLASSRKWKRRIYCTLAGAAAMALAAGIFFAARSFALGWKEPMTIYVNASPGEVRSSPKLENNVIARPDSGTALFLLRSREGWSMILYKTRDRAPASLSKLAGLGFCGSIQFQSRFCGDGWINYRMTTQVND